MSNQKNQSGLLNRNKSENGEALPFQKIFDVVERETINNLLATQFPEWDLTPPGNLVKRRSTKLL